jgi:hypothetical protein
MFKHGAAPPHPLLAPQQAGCAWLHWLVAKCAVSDQQECHSRQSRGLLEAGRQARQQRRTWPSLYLLVRHEPSTSITGREVKFSEAISSMPFLQAASRRAATCHGRPSWRCMATHATGLAGAGARGRAQQTGRFAAPMHIESLNHGNLGMAGPALPGSHIAQRGVIAHDPRTTASSSRPQLFHAARGPPPACIGKRSGRRQSTLPRLRFEARAVGPGLQAVGPPKFELIAQHMPK